MGFGDSISRAV